VAVSGKGTCTSVQGQCQCFFLNHVKEYAPCPSEEKKPPHLAI